MKPHFLVLFWLICFVNDGFSESTDSIGKSKFRIFVGYRYWSGTEYYYNQYGKHSLYGTPSISTFSKYQICRHNLEALLSFKINKYFEIQGSIGGIYFSGFSNLLGSVTFGYSPFKNFLFGIGYTKYQFSNKSANASLGNNDFNVGQKEFAALIGASASYLIHFKNLEFMLKTELPLISIPDSGGFDFESNQMGFPGKAHYPPFQLFDTIFLSLSIKVL